MGNATALVKKLSTWFWWGGDCEACLERCGLYRVEPDNLPPLHPNCDCVVARLELGREQAGRMEEISRRSVRLTSEINLLHGDRNLSGREREVLDLCGSNLDEAMRDAVRVHRVEDYQLSWIEWNLIEAERQSSRIKYRLSREAAERVSGPLERKAYSSRALDKIDELHERFSAAALEFNANLRAIEAAFADEFGRRGKTDEWQDEYFHDRWDISRRIPFANDYGLSNIDYHTAARVQKKYSIDIPLHMKLDEYLCTEEGCVKFTAAAIREAQDELGAFTANLSGDERAIMDNLNQDEKDALLVTIYKRGMEKFRLNLEKQLKKILEGKSAQRYLFICEGYLAWRLWVMKEN